MAITRPSLPDNYWYDVFLEEIQKGDYAEASRTLGLITCDPPEYPVKTHGKISIPTHVAAIFMLGGKLLEMPSYARPIRINWEYVEIIDNTEEI